VGFGDITAHSWSERLFVILWMLASVFLYSLAIGSWTSFIDQMDKVNQVYMNRLGILRNI
jgi:hyperpolarization activated cyclic nucleotide-gated potassium channel 1